MDIRVVNALTYEEFVELFGNVVEKCPIISAAIWSNRPFKDLTDIEAHITEFIDSLSDSGMLFFLLYQLNNIWYHVFLSFKHNNLFTGLYTIKVHYMCSGKEGILRCHPDLAGRDLQSGTLTRESREEQGQAGMTALDSAEILLMHRLNSEYRERFGFPFVICARLNNKADIMRRLSERLENDCAAERELAIEEVKKICSLRLHNIVLSDIQTKL